MSYRAELIEHYKQVRSRLMGKPPRPELPAPAPIIVVEEEELAELIKPRLLPQRKPDGRPKVETIIELTAAHFDFTREQLMSPCQKRKFARPRHVAIYLARELNGASFPEIGRRFGGRDHTTILHGHRKVLVSLKHDAELAYDVATIEAQL